ncbi:PP2C family protein-serine/threonine phosphatase [Microcella sp.]|uniref:PP2C family protein-serine/threonine phosphatase n=1 Tax=Microcella sp. TaxID=1913979 RepID=UPI00299F5ED1|nr:protein phosphatase 2C domain-containing protein [Microcella sp.]MDX2025307.1 protein phosphatase 2C domain-containing protein [Microcella sp.]
MTALGRSSVRHIVALPERGEVIELSWHGVTHTGYRRAANEDSYLADVPLFAVADGMGGHSHGDRASDAVVRRLQAAVDGEFIAPEAIIDALHLATWDIHQLDEADRGIGTTVTGVALSLADGRPVLTSFNVGDSRVYRFSGNDLVQVTTDHSMVQEMVDSGQLSAEQAEHHPDSNVITRAVGFSVEPEVDVRVIGIEAGMRLLVCSDGLTKEVPLERLRLHMAARLSARETANALVDAALAQGGRDNITVIVVDVVRAPGGQ